MSLPGEKKQKLALSFHILVDILHHLLTMSSSNLAQYSAVILKVLCYSRVQNFSILFNYVRKNVVYFTRHDYGNRHGLN
jgi:hypothetical protein